MINFKIAFFAAMLSGFLYGYNFGVFADAFYEIQRSYSMSDIELQNLVALFEYGEIIGVLLFFLADRYGRRNTLLWFSLAACIAPLLPLLESSFITLLLARGLLGVVVGYIFVVALSFVTEISSKAYRPIMLSTLMVGISVGYITQLGLNAELIASHGWRIAIALGAVPAFVQFLGLMTMRESPAYYRLRGQTKESLSAARFYQLDLEQIKDAPSEPGIKGILFSLRQSSFRKELLGGLILVAAATIEGHALLLSYGSVVLDYFGVTDHKEALFTLDLFALLALAASFVALAFVARGYTHNILVASLIAIGIIQLLLGFSQGFMAIILLGGLYVSFAFGIRTTVFQLIPQLFNDSTRATGVAILNLVFLFVAATYAEYALTLFDALGHFIFYVHGVVALMLAIVFMRYFSKVRLAQRKKMRPIE